MFNLKSIQKTILILSVIVFLISFVLILVLAVSNPHGFLATSTGTKPITTFTSKEVKLYSYGDKLTIPEDVKVKDDFSTIISQNLNITLASKNELTADGLIYLKSSDLMSVKLSSLVSVELTKGEYFINTNPIKIHVLSGEVIYKQVKVANVNQTALWQVDRFKANTLNTDDFIVNDNYSDLVKLLKEINLLPSQLTNLSLNISDADTITVSDSEDPDLVSGCESNLLNQQLLCKINNYRVENKLQKLELDGTLSNLSLSHVIWMDINQSTSTIESNGLSFKERCNNGGIECISEINLLIGEYNSDIVFNQIILDSSILNKKASLIGINVSGNYLSILLR